MEEIPETETATPVRFAPALTGERQTASERLSALAARLGLRDDGGPAGGLALHTLSDGELRGWLRDRRILSGADSDEEYARSIAAADSEVVAVGRDHRALGPTDQQRVALAELHRDALGSLDVRWNAVGGSPRQIEGFLFLERGRDPAVVADDYVRSAWPLLKRLVGADDQDSVEAVAQGGGANGGLRSIVFRRLRDGMHMPQNAIEVFVTTPAHAVGAGLVQRLWIEWDRVHPSPSAPLLSRDDALLLASDELGVDLLADTDAADTDLLLRCIHLAGGARACGPTWRVFWRTRPPPVSWDTPPESRDDTVYLDAESGVVITTADERPNYVGSVNVTSNWAYDTSDSYRDYRYARLLSYAEVPPPVH